MTAGAASRTVADRFAPVTAGRPSGPGGARLELAPLDFSQVCEALPYLVTPATVVREVHELVGVLGEVVQLVVLVVEVGVDVEELRARSSLEVVVGSPRTTTSIGSQLAELKGSDTVANDDFGYSVAISGTTAIVGAWGHASGAGRAYVFAA